jgi:hypothetical protein
MMSRILATYTCTFLFLFQGVLGYSPKVLAAGSLFKLDPAIPEGFYSMREMQKEVDFAMEYTSQTLRSGHQINRDIGKIPLDEIENEAGEKYLRQVFENYIDLYEKKLGMHHKMLDFFRDTYGKLHYAVMWRDFKALVTKTKVSLKVKGAGFWLAMFAGIINEVIFDLTAWTINPWLLGITMSIPYNVLWVSGTYSFQRMKMKSRLVAVLGSTEKYDEYINYKKSLKETFKTKNFDRYLVPLKTVDGNIETVVVNKRSLWEKLLWKMDSDTKLGWKSILRKAGLKDGAVNYFNLSLFLESNGIENKYISSVKASKLDQKAKTALILNHLFTSMPEETLTKFREKFSSSFVSLKQSPNWVLLRPWTEDMLKAKSFDDMRKLFKEIPDWVDSREIRGIWKNILLPHYSVTFNIGYFRYRNILEELEEMDAKHFVSSNNKWELQVATDFLEHVRHSIGTKNSIPSCKNSPEKVMLYLLNNLGR